MICKCSANVCHSHFSQEPTGISFGGAGFKFILLLQGNNSINSKFHGHSPPKKPHPSPAAEKMVENFFFQKFRFTHGTISSTLTRLGTGESIKMLHIHSSESDLPMYRTSESDASWVTTDLQTSVAALFDPPFYRYSWPNSWLSSGYLISRLTETSGPFSWKIFCAYEWGT